MNSPSSRRAYVLPEAPPPRHLRRQSPVPPPLKADPDRNCPRCHTILTDPHGIGLCPRCGFCRSLAVEGVAVLAAAGRKQRWAPVFRGLRHALHVAPAALVAVCLAFVAVVPLAYLADQRLAPGSRERALWSAGNVLAGLLLLLSGQAWAITLLKQMKERVSWGDLLSPLQLWGLTLRRLPATAWPVGLGGSGALTVLAAVVWVGGLSPTGSACTRRPRGARRRGRVLLAATIHATRRTWRVARVLGLSKTVSEEATQAETRPGATAVEDTVPVCTVRGRSYDRRPAS